MIALQITSAGEYLDLGKDASINFSWNNTFLQEDFIEGDYSFNFNIPNNSKNKKLLGILQKINVKVEGNARLDAKLYLKSKFMFDCTLAFDKTTFSKNKEYISVRISKNLAKFANIIKDKQLKDVDTDESVVQQITQDWYEITPSSALAAADFWVFKFSVPGTVGGVPQDFLGEVASGTGENTAGDTIAENMQNLAERINEASPVTVSPAGLPNTGLVSIAAEADGETLKLISTSAIENVKLERFSDSTTFNFTNNTHKRISIAATKTALAGLEFVRWRTKYEDFLDINTRARPNNQEILPAVPCVTLKRVFQKLSDFTTYSFEGEFINDTELQSLIVINNITLDEQSENFKQLTVNLSSRVLKYANHYPNMSISTFLKKLRNMFCLDIRIDDVNKIVNINFKKSYLEKGFKDYTKYHKIQEIQFEEKKNFVLQYADSYNKDFDIPNSSLSFYQNVDKTVPSPKKFDNDEDVVLGASTLTYSDETQPICYDFTSKYVSVYLDSEVVYQNIKESDKISELVLVFKTNTADVLYLGYASQINETGTHSLDTADMLADYWQDYLEFKIEAKTVIMLVWLTAVELKNFDTDTLLFIKNMYFAIENAETVFNNTVSKPLKLKLKTVE